MRSERRLTTEFGDDSHVEQYRIRGREVEFRARRADRPKTPHLKIG
jgi:hypothetical protein